MDDRELEARLRERLRNRFDARSPSTELAGGVAQQLATKPQAVRWARLRAGQLRLGWSLAAVTAVAAIAIVAANLRPAVAPGSKPTAPPASTAPQQRERSFVVLPPAGHVPSKPDQGVASEVLSARLRALGYGNFSSAIGFAISFKVPPEGPTDEETRRVLAATGSVEFVPLPPADYGDGLLVAEVGKPLPKHEPAMFGWEGIASVTWGTDQQDRPTLRFKLKPVAAQAFGDYTAGHVNEHLAILVDGKVAFLPVIQARIPDGEVAISSGGDDAEAFHALGAILVGGMLPESWRGAEVPQIVDEQTAVATALGFYPSADVESAGVTSLQDESGTRAVWWIVLGGDLPHSCPMLRPGATVCPAPDGGIVVVIDAVTGQVVSIDSNG
jgi:hypothetical protein